MRRDCGRGDVGIRAAGVDCSCRKVVRPAIAPPETVAHVLPPLTVAKAGPVPSRPPLELPVDVVTLNGKRPGGRRDIDRATDGAGDGPGGQRDGACASGTNVRVAGVHGRSSQRKVLGDGRDRVWCKGQHATVESQGAGADLGGCVARIVQRQCATAQGEAAELGRAVATEIERPCSTLDELPSGAEADRLHGTAHRGGGAAVDDDA